MENLVAGSPTGWPPAAAVGVAGERTRRLPSSDAAARKADSDPPGPQAGQRRPAYG